MPDHTALSDMLRALEHDGARTLVAGTLARKLHGDAVEASDAVIWYDCDGDHAERVLRALARVGAPLEGISANDLCSLNYAFRYGEGEREIRLVGGMDGVAFEDAWETRVESASNGVPLRIVGRDTLRAIELAARAR